jgi:hypothetical protein
MFIKNANMVKERKYVLVAVERLYAFTRDRKVNARRKSV